MDIIIYFSYYSYYFQDSQSLTYLTIPDVFFLFIFSHEVLLILIISQIATQAVFNVFRSHHILSEAFDTFCHLKELTGVTFYKLKLNALSTCHWTLR